MTNKPASKCQPQIHPRFGSEQQPLVTWLYFSVLHTQSFKALEIVAHVTNNIIQRLSVFHVNPSVRLSFSQIWEMWISQWRHQVGYCGNSPFTAIFEVPLHLMFRESWCCHWKAGWSYLNQLTSCTSHYNHPPIIITKHFFSTNSVRSLA